MQVVIDIPEEKDLVTKAIWDRLNDNEDINILINALGKGTILPEKHGRLIDSNEMIEDLQHQCETVFRLDAVKPEDYYIAKDAKFMQATWKTWCEDFCKWAANRPTILEATEGDNAHN